MNYSNSEGQRPRTGLRVAAVVALLWLAVALGVTAGTCRAATDEAAAALWFDAAGLSVQARQLLAIMGDAEAYGLRSADYVSAPLQRMLAGGAEPQSRASLDAALTAAVTRFVGHVHYGRVDPRKLGFNLTPDRQDIDVVAQVQALAHSADVPAAVAQLEPHFYHYRLMKAALARYRSLAQHPELTRLPAFGPPALHAGDAYAGLGALKRLLVAVGDLSAQDAAGASDQRIDATSKAAIASFQSRHEIPATGTLDRRTFAALTTPLSTRVRQIELALERARWLPAFDTPPIIVNIPEFELFAFRTTADREPDIIKMPVIVGKVVERTRTPIFIGGIKYLIFRPYWNVPRSILEHELLAKIRASPAYLAVNHFELVRGESDDSPVVEATPDNIAALAAGQLRLRQRPGADNALGLIKFVFPNSHDIYLHGTSAPGLFHESTRALSHGCIRVGDPVALAAYVLRDTPGEWTPEKIAAAMSDGDSRRVDLQKPITVIIFYSTVLATESGRVLFFNDIYGHDRRLQAALGLGPP